MSDNFKTLGVKEKIAYSTAIAAFCLGWMLTIASFIVGKGEISDSVLWVLGQSLVYAASVLGVGMYVGSSVRNMKRDIANYLNSNKNDIEELA